IKLQKLVIKCCFFHPPSFLIFLYFHKVRGRTEYSNPSISVELKPSELFNKWNTDIECAEFLKLVGRYWKNDSMGLNGCRASLYSSVRMHCDSFLIGRNMTEFAQYYD